jgi:endoribonuclease LACTB2
MPHALAMEVVEVPNTGAMSGRPTNATIVGTTEVFVVDPGEASGIALIEAALARRGTVRVAAIILTHGHHDHATAAAELRRTLGAPVMLNPREKLVLGDSFDWSDVDGELAGGMTLAIADGRLEVIDTPGHSPGHVAFYDRASRTLIAGDLGTGYGTVSVSAPHGKMAAYLDSLARAQLLGAPTIIPGHGATMTQPPDVFAQYLARRLTREREIYDVLARHAATIPEIVGELYLDLPPHFRRAAIATVLAHLEKLSAEGRVAPESDDLMASRWEARRPAGYPATAR